MARRQRQSRGSLVKLVLALMVLIIAIAFPVAASTVIIVSLCLLCAWLPIRHILYSKIKNMHMRIGLMVEVSFVIPVCSRCREREMWLNDVSPSAQSVTCECTHCKKMARGYPNREMDTEQKKEIARIWRRITTAVSTYNNIVPRSKSIERMRVNLFSGPGGSKPEARTRESIPQHVRSEVWDRAGGKCVICGSTENLQYDHILPFSKGGGEMVGNLQILCRDCNLAKSDKI